MLDPGRGCFNSHHHHHLPSATRRLTPNCSLFKWCTYCIVRKPQLKTLVADSRHSASLTISSYDLNARHDNKVATNVRDAFNHVLTTFESFRLTILTNFSIPFSARS
jgi:hypothetical protein